MTVLTSPSWARVDGPLAPYADGSGLSWSGWDTRR